MESLCFKQLRIEWLERLTCRSRSSQGYPLRFYSTENSEEPNSEPGTRNSELASGRLEEP